MYYATFVKYQYVFRALFFPVCNGSNRLGRLQALQVFCGYLCRVNSKVSIELLYIFILSFCTGPVAGALVNRFGCRAVAMTGSVWAAVAFFIATYAPNVDILIILYGALGGRYFLHVDFSKVTTGGWQGISCYDHSP